MYGLNPNSGWMDGEIFTEWFLRHFLVYAPAGRPLLLLIDGHSSHFNPEFIRQAASHGVMVFCLPPNTTHVCQPLDNTCFRSLKAFWNEACDDYMGCHPGKVITIYQFSMLFASAFFRAFTPRNITASFRATGVFPPNSRAIPIPGYSLTTKDVATPTAKVAQRQGIQYLPFYSPPCSKEVSQVPSFTAAETERFQVRFEEGYDLTHDERYNLWLQVHHPNSGPGVRKELSFDSYLHSSEGSSFSESWTGEGKVPFGEIPTGGGSPAIEEAEELNVVFVRRPIDVAAASVQSNLSEYLNIPTPPGARQQPKTPQRARVLTSQEYIREMEKKEKEKREKEEDKERKRREREERAKKKAAEKESKSRERENRARMKAAEKERKSREREEAARKRVTEKERKSREKEEAARKRASEKERKNREREEATQMKAAKKERKGRERGEVTQMKKAERTTQGTHVAG